MDKTIWITSDSHFCHNKDFIFKPRGFSTVEEMNEAIIERWNSVVKEGDIVYHLGDVMMGTDLAWGMENLPRLNGEKYLALGNHDTDNKISFYKEHCIFKDIQFGYRIKFKKKCFLTTHYPTITANGNDCSTLNLFGHTHQQTNFFQDAAGIRTYMYHVGMDSHDCTPVNLEDLYTEIRNLGKEAG